MTELNLLELTGVLFLFLIGVLLLYTIYYYTKPKVSKIVGCIHDWWRYNSKPWCDCMCANCEYGEPEEGEDEGWVYCSKHDKLFYFNHFCAWAWRRKL